MEVTEFLRRGITPWHTRELIAETLAKSGFAALEENKEWKLERGKAYYTTRGAGLVAFRMGELDRFAVSACHTDSPCLKLKQAPVRRLAGAYLALTEPYGGGIWHTWTDRPLGVAGLVMTRIEGGADRRLIDLNDRFVIPSLAIHYDRDVNKGFAVNASTDLNLVTDRPIDTLIAEAAGVKEEDILSADLSVYSAETPYRSGGLVCAPRADDLVSAAAMLAAIVSADSPRAIPVAYFATHEEVGSGTYSGAGGTFLADTLDRIASARGVNLARMLADSLLLSVDNAHAEHPLHPALAQSTDSPILGGGVVIKFNANARYTTDAESAAAVRAIAHLANAQTQNFSMRSDLACGSTLGVVSSAQVSVRAADIGIAQLAMHASCETFAAGDYAAIEALLAVFAKSALAFDGGVRVL